MFVPISSLETIKINEAIATTSCFLFTCYAFSRVSVIRNDGRRAGYPGGEQEDGEIAGEEGIRLSNRTITSSWNSIRNYSILRCLLRKRCLGMAHRRGLFSQWISVSFVDLCPRTAGRSAVGQTLGVVPRDGMETSDFSMESRNFEVPRPLFQAGRPPMGNHGQLVWLILVDVFEVYGNSTGWKRQD